MVALVRLASARSQTTFSLRTRTLRLLCDCIQQITTSGGHTHMALTPCSRRIVVRLYQVDRPCVPWRVRSKNPTRPRAVPPGSTKDVEDRGNVSQWVRKRRTYCRYRSPFLHPFSFDQSNCGRIWDGGPKFWQNKEKLTVMFVVKWRWSRDGRFDSY